MNTYKLIRTNLAVLYISFILWLTVFSRTPGLERIFKGLFWKIQVGYWRDIILNILLLVTLGLLINGRRAVIGGVVFSFGIEIIQYIFKLGFCEVDDVINNSIGVILGAYFAREVSKIIERRLKKEICMSDLLKD